MYLHGVIKVIKVYVAIFDRFLGANKIRDFVIFVWDFEGGMAEWAIYY